MADTVGVKYIYPQDWDGFYDNIREGHRRIVVELWGLSDGTNEAAVRKLVVSDFRRSDGQVASKFAIEKIVYSVTEGMTVELLFDSLTDEHLVMLTGQGEKEFPGGNVMQAESGTGDIMLTSASGGAGDSYSIVITARLK